MSDDTDDLPCWVPGGSAPMAQPSRLHPIEPIGAGTFAVESLTSYFSRVSASHSLPVSDVARHEIAPLLNHDYLNPGKATFNSFAAAAAMNGHGKTASEWVKALEALTQRNYLANLTLLPFQGIVAQKGLLNPKRAWCPVCLDGWRREGKIIYEPLLWKMNEVKACPIHYCGLSTMCPHCRSQLPNLVHRILPGICSVCGKWLSDGIVSTRYAAHGYEVFTASTIGELLACVPELKALPTIDHQVAFIDWLLKKWVRGGITSLARLLKVRNSYVLDWQRGEYRIAIYNLAKICYTFRVSMAEIATLGFLKCHDDDLGAPTPPPDGLVVSQSPVDWHGVESALTDIVAGKKTPATVRSIARSFNCDVSGLYRKLPDLCKQVARLNFESGRRDRNQKYAQLEHQIRDYLSAQNAAGVVPTKVEVFSEFGGRSRKRQELVKNIFDDLAIMPVSCEP